MKPNIPAEYAVLLSWEDAHSACKLYNKSLPSFVSMQEVTRFLDEIETRRKFDMIPNECEKNCALHEYDPVAVYLGMKMTQQVTRIC